MRLTRSAAAGATPAGFPDYTRAGADARGRARFPGPDAVVLSLEYSRPLPAGTTIIAEHPACPREGN